MATKAQKTAPSVVAEAREKARQRFEKSRTRKKYGWTFEEWERRFVCGDKFTAIASELTPTATRHFVKDIFHRYFSFLEEEHKLGRELRLEDYKAGEYVRRESDLPENSMVRSVLRMARAVGYKAEVAVDRGNKTMTNGVRINGHFVIIYPARSATIFPGHTARPTASFRIGQKILSEKTRAARKVGGIILYMAVPEYPERMFTYTCAEILEKLFGEFTPESKCISIPITEPKQIKATRRKFDHWRDHEGRKGFMRLQIPG